MAASVRLVRLSVRVAWTGVAWAGVAWAGLSVRVVWVVWVVVPAVRLFAWVWRGDPVDPAVRSSRSRMPQASTTHADLVRTRMVVSLSFQGK
jgi:hypothetical protein